LKIHPGYREIFHGFTYNGHLYIIGFVSLSLWFTVWLYQRYLKKRSAVNLFFAPLSVWIMINFAIAAYLPGAGFFIIPFLVGVAVFGHFILKPKDSAKKVIVSTVLTVPALLIVVPLIELFPIALGLQMTLIATLIASLLLLLLMPIWSSFAGLKNLNKLFLITAILVFASASYTAGFNEDSKRPDSVLYIRDESTSNGYWGSRDLETDEFTRQFLGENPEQGAIPDRVFQDAGISNFNYHNSAAPIQLEPSLVKILSDTVMSDQRHLRVSIRPNRAINRMDIRLKKGTRVLSLEVQKEKAVKKGNTPFLVSDKGGRSLFQYYFSVAGEPLEFSYVIPAEDDPSLFLFELTHDFQNLPEIKNIKPEIQPRPDHLMPNTFFVSDAVLNLREIKF
jgi:hypothetical protein